MASESSDGEQILGCILAIVLLPFAWAMRGYVLAWLWLWFVVPFGIQEITAVHGCGIAVMGWSVVVRRPSDSSKNAIDNAAEMLCSAFVVPLIVLSVGWCVQRWM